jgi:hypothetical protein
MCRSGAPGRTHSGDALCARSVRVVGAQIGSSGASCVAALLALLTIASAPGPALKGARQIW